MEDTTEISMNSSELSDSLEFSGFTPEASPMELILEPANLNSTTIINIKENSASYTLNFNPKAIADFSKCLISLHEPYAIRNHKENGEIHSIMFENNPVHITLYYSTGCILVQGSAQKAWIESELPNILKLLEPKEESSVVQKSGLWSKVSAVFKSPFQKMKTPKKDTPMEYTRNYTDDPPPYPLYPGATSTPLTLEPQKLSFSENSTSLEETRIQSLLLHSAIQSLVYTIDGLSRNKKVLLENAEICHTGCERPPDLNILTNMVKGLIQRLDKLDMDKTDEQSVNTPENLNIADTQTDMIHSEPINSEINKKLK